MKKFFLLLAFIIILAFTPIAAQAQLCTTVQMSATETCQGVLTKTVQVDEEFGICWQNNSESDLAGYRVYVNGTVLDICGSTEIPAEFNNLDGLYFSEPGIYEINLTAFDTEGLESNFSETMIVIVEEPVVIDPEEGVPPADPAGCFLTDLLYSKAEYYILQT